jgi:hypothetical protein
MAFTMLPKKTNIPIIPVAVSSPDFLALPAYSQAAETSSPGMGVRNPDTSTPEIWSFVDR